MTEGYVTVHTPCLTNPTSCPHEYVCVNMFVNVIVNVSVAKRLKELNS